MKVHQLVFAGAAVAALGCHANSAVAQTPASSAKYPDRPIRVIVPSSVGSGSDIMMRAISGPLQASLGQPVVIENIGGAAGIIGAERTKNSEPNGYTLVFGNLSSIVMAPLGVTPVPYDPTKDFEAIAPVYQVLLTVTVNSSVPAKNLRELVDHIRANPGKLNYATPGPMSFSHVWTEMLLKQQKLSMSHVPYKGAGPAFVATLNGEAQVTVAETATMAGLMSSPNVRVIVQLGPRRGGSLPDVETLAEAGFPELTSSFWFGLLAPRGTPPTIINRLNEEFNRAMEAPEIKKMVVTAGGEALKVDPQTFAKMLASDTAKWGPIIREIDPSARQ